MKVKYTIGFSTSSRIPNSRIQLWWSKGSVVFCDFEMWLSEVHLFCKLHLCLPRRYDREGDITFFSVVSIYLS